MILKTNKFTETLQFGSRIFCIKNWKNNKKDNIDISNDKHQRIGVTKYFRFPVQSLVLHGVIRILKIVMKITFDGLGLVIKNRVF
jgi:hypothetical protein